MISEKLTSQEAISQTINDYLDMRVLIDKFRGRYGLGHLQADILIYLCQQSSGSSESVPISDILKRFSGINATNISRVVTNLEQRGYARRDVAPLPQPRNTIIVYPTNKGRKAYQTLETLLGFKLSGMYKPLNLPNE